MTKCNCCVVSEFSLIAHAAPRSRDISHFRLGHVLSNTDLGEVVEAREEGDGAGQNKVAVHVVYKARVVNLRLYASPFPVRTYKLSVKHYMYMQRNVQHSRRFKPHYMCIILCFMS